MDNLPPIFKELWEAISTIVEKVSGLLSKALLFLWGILVWLFERFVDLIQLIADKI